MKITSEQYNEILELLESAQDLSIEIELDECDVGSDFDVYRKIGDAISSLVFVLENGE